MEWMTSEFREMRSRDGFSIPARTKLAELGLDQPLEFVFSEPAKKFYRFRATARS